MLAILIAIGLAVLLTGLLLHALFLWLLCRLLGVRRPLPSGDAAPIRYRRALGVVCLGALVNLALLAAIVFLGPQESLPLAIGVVVAQVVVVVLLLRWWIAPRVGQAVLLAVLWLALMTGYGVGFAYLAPTTLLAAYIMPTGSMAETVLGYHKLVRCPSCGLEFPVNASTEVAPPEGPPLKVVACTCPNCRQHIHFAGAPIQTMGEPSAGLVSDPGVQGGDRLLFFTGVLGSRLAPLQRFDLAAFRYPGPHPGTEPVLYLKRLIGLPGETIAIHGGNLYLRKDSDPTPGASQAERPDMRADEDLPAWKEHKFHILRKSPDQVLPLMRLVHDNDHPAKGQPARWKGEGWTAAQDNGFHHESGGQETHWLRYHHLLRGSAERPALISDFLGYNTGEIAPPIEPSENWVKDLILECETTVEKSEGELILELSSGVDRFRARWDLSKGVCSLMRIRGKKEEQLAEGEAPLPPGAHQLRLANVDEQLVLWVDDRLPLGSTPYPAPDREGPSEDNDLEPASVGVKGAAVTVRKLKLFRDIFYTAGGDDPTRADVSGVNLTDPTTWAPLEHAPVRTYRIATGHYFFLGDNSQQSSDSRSWGLVAERHLLGKAVIVYYPWKRMRTLP